MKLLNCSQIKRGSVALPRFTFFLGLLATVFYLISGPITETLVFDREAVLNGQWWRLISGHWLHSGVNHALWDIGAFIILGWVLEHNQPRDLFISIIVGSVVVDVWVWYGMPDLDLYCGLSGLLNTMLVVALYHSWKISRNNIIILIGLISILKIGIEVQQNESLFVHTLWPSVPEAHAAGFLAGVVVIAGYSIFPLILRKLVNQQQNAKQKRLKSKIVSL